MKPITSWEGRPLEDCTKAELLACIARLSALNERLVDTDSQPFESVARQRNFLKALQGRCAKAERELAAAQALIAKLVDIVADTTRKLTVR